jgi:hypothetical protein
MDSESGFPKNRELRAFPYLHGGGQASQSQQAKASVSAQIAGRVLRADIDEPLANVVVTLSHSCVFWAASRLG